MAVPLHPDGLQLVQRLHTAGINDLYHFTCIDNLPSIRDAAGLCSKGELERRGVWPCPEPGGNALSHGLDHRFGNWDMVPFNMTPNTPMLYRKKRERHLCFVVVDATIASRAGVLLTDTNAAKAGHTRADGLQGLALLDLDVLRPRSPKWVPAPEWKFKVQAEILVPCAVELALVSRFLFLSAASLHEGERLWGPTPHPPFQVAPDAFVDGGYSALSFPHVERVVLTDEVVGDLNGVYQHFESFTRRPDGRLSLIARLFAVTGSKSEATWVPAGRRSELEFPASRFYFVNHDIPMGALGNGEQYVEVYLNGIRWIRIPFILQD